MQCAQARYAFELNCSLKTADDGTETLGRQVVAGNDPKSGLNPALASNRTTLDISAGLNGAMSETFSAQCPADLSFNVMGKSVQVSMTNVCTWLTAIGNIGVMASLLAGMLIVGKGGG